ncbi:MAG: hypothetical protein HW400_231 [Candidatus Levybacteria bacterium]|nr:hypothetical protein [Candidatus Levybacteria bacterium]
MARKIESAETSSGLTEKLKEKNEPSLGEFNPLLFPPNLGNSEATSALKLVIERRIKNVGGVKPKTVDSVLTFNTFSEKLEPRFVVKFETDSLSESQIDHLEQLTRNMYGRIITGRTTPSGGHNPISPYPMLEAPKKNNLTRKSFEDQKQLGWYMGEDQRPLSNASEGLLVHRIFDDIGMPAYLKTRTPKEWFCKDGLVTPTKKAVKTKYNIEIREASMYQTDIVEFATQVSAILSKGKPLDNPKLKYEIYNDLNRLGLKHTTEEDIRGLEEQIERIERTLILPLANLDASSGIDFKPGSILLIGVPGTGKTYVIEYFLQKDTGVFILPIDAQHLATELAQPPEKKTILPRISEVFKQTQIPIILHIDDIENMAPDNEKLINSTLLNLMAGVRENGFFVIASTNYPEKLTSQLLQPQRLSEVVYFGLQEEGVRLNILKSHANRLTKELSIPLFPSDLEREDILKAIAINTDGFTPRFLAQICTEAKSFYLERMSQLKKTKVGMVEKDLDKTFQIEDWAKGLTEVWKKYDKTSVLKRDGELKIFAKQHYNSTLGFTKDRLDGHHTVFDLRTTMAEIKRKEQAADNNPIN